MTDRNAPKPKRGEPRQPTRSELASLPKMTLITDRELEPPAEFIQEVSSIPPIKKPKSK